MPATLIFSSRTAIKSVLLSMLVTSAFSALYMESTIKVSGDPVSPEKQPLLLIHYPLRPDDRVSLAVPKISGDSVTVEAEDGSELWLMCSPEREVDSFKNMEDKITGRAVVRNLQPVTTWQLSHIQCLNKITPSTYNTGIRCGSCGTIHQTGFLVYFGTDDEEFAPLSIESNKREKKGHGRRFALRSSSSSKHESKKKEIQWKSTEFVSLLESCYDGRRKMVLFSRLTIHGSLFQAKARLDSIPVLPDGEWSYDNRELTALYAKDEQFKRFLSILNKEDDVTVYNDRAIRFLIQTQLTPADNMIFYSWRAATFTQYNTTGLWESIYGIGWRRVEEAVDQYISRNRLDVQVVTGTHEILKLGQKSRDIYLQPNTRPPNTGVAKLIWKLLYNTTTLEAVVFISINNPHAQTCEPTPWCKDRCSNDDSPLASFKDPWTGCIICCSYEDATKEITDMPRLEKVAPRVLPFHRINPSV